VVFINSTIWHDRLSDKCMADSGEDVSAVSPEQGTRCAYRSALGDQLFRGRKCWDSKLKSDHVFGINKGFYM
jgi:hypothetical protein